MAVICIGRSWLIDEASERRRFEAQLDRVGFRHEEFTLQVAPLSDPQRSAAAERRGYDVKVIHLPTRSVKAYRGGEDGDWVAAFANDLGNGLYGQSNEGIATSGRPPARTGSAIGRPNTAPANDSDVVRPDR
jgi:hypothetical protein